MGRKSGTRRAAALAPYFRAFGVVDGLSLARQQRHFFGAKQFGQEQPTLAIEVLDLLLGQFHGVLLAFSGGKPPCSFGAKNSTGTGVLPTRSGADRYHGVARPLAWRSAVTPPETPARSCKIVAAPGRTSNDWCRRSSRSLNCRCAPPACAAPRAARPWCRRRRSTASAA